MELGSNIVRRNDTAPDNSAQIISVAEACRFLGVHRNTLYKLITEGDLPAFRLTTGGRWKFRKTDLDEWLENRQVRGIR